MVTGLQLLFFFAVTLFRHGAAFLTRLPPVESDQINDGSSTTTTTVAFQSALSQEGPEMTKAAPDMGPSDDQLEIVLFGVGDLRRDDHEGLHRAVLSGKKVLPLVILDDDSLSKIPSVVSHTIDTVCMLVAAVADLQQSLQEKLNLDLQVISTGSSSFLESLLGAVEGCSATSVRVHVHDLGDADNYIGYGPYSKLQELERDNLLPSNANVEIVPWTNHLREQPWTKVESLPDRYPDYVQMYANSQVPNLPVSLEDGDVRDVLSCLQGIQLSTKDAGIPSVESLVSRLRAKLGLNPATSKAEVNTGIFQSHWGGLDASTVVETSVLKCLSAFLVECKEDDALFVKHSQYPGNECSRNERSLEHATFGWMLRGTDGGPNTNNLLAGEPMTRYLAAPLLFGTLSPRRLWHMSTRKRPYFFVSPLKTLVEGREWHKLLAAKNIRTRSEYDLSEDGCTVENGKTRYGYWRWHGFLCRYAQTPLATKQSGSPTWNSNNKEGVLLFHGFGASGSQWNKAMKELSAIVAEEEKEAQSKREGLAPDLLGFGHSEKPPISYSIYVWDSQCTDFVKEVAVFRHGWGDYIVGGNSIGGFSAASTAANDGVGVDGCSLSSSGAPGTGKCRGVVLMNPAGPILSREEVLAKATGDDGKLLSVAQVSASGSLPPCNPPPRAVARTFGNGLLSYLRPRIQSICVNLYPTNPAAVDDNLCTTIERDSVDPGGIAVMISGAKLPPPRSMNEMLRADYGSASDEKEASFGGPVLVATGVLDPLNDAKGRSEGLAALRAGIQFDPINAGHCPHDELPKEVSGSIAKWWTTTVRSNTVSSKTTEAVGSVPL